MELTDQLTLLAEQNRSGVSFLVAYGVTWIACAACWRYASERTAAYATLFQGLVAFPAAMVLSYLIGALGQGRPVSDEITSLSILIGTSQLLGLPFLIYLTVKAKYRLVPFAFAAITSMHFVLYAWLYQTPLYIIMAVLVSGGTAAIMFATTGSRARTAAIRVCAFTGGVLLLTALVFLAIHLVP